MKNIPLLLGTIFGTILMIVGVAVIFSKSGAPANQAGEVMVDQAALVQDATKMKGPETAPVTIVEFSDFQCPACRAAQPAVNQVLAQYPEQVKVVYRHFPLDTIHPNARLAAQAAEVAHEYEKFWEYHDKLFATQDQWSKISSKDQLKEQFAVYAEELQIDKQAFLEKIESQAAAAAVQADVEVGNSIPVQATPTFFVNGKLTTAPQLLPTVQSLTSEVQE